LKTQRQIKNKIKEETKRFLECQKTSKHFHVDEDKLMQMAYQRELKLRTGKIKALKWVLNEYT